MAKKKKIFIAAAIIFIAAFSVIYKMPKGIEDIIIYPFYFNENGNYSCFGGIPEKQRMYFPPDDKDFSYEEISSLIKEAEFIADFRNIIPIKYTFEKFIKSGSSSYIGKYNSVIVIEFGEPESTSCDVSFYDDGTVAVSSFDYHDVIYSYRLKDRDFYNRLWDYIEENGNVYMESE